MNTKERILAALRGEKPEGRVIWVPTVGVSVEAMKKIDAGWPASHWDAKKMARAAASTYELTGVACCTVPFCLTLEGEALGCALDKGTDITQPQIMEHLETGFDEFEVPADFMQRGRIPAVLEAISLLAASQRDIQPVNVKVTGPFTIACALTLSTADGGAFAGACALLAMRTLMTRSVPGTSSAGRLRRRPVRVRAMRRSGSVHR